MTQNNNSKIFIDTNVYLDFYRSTGSSIDILKELSRFKNSLVMTTQVYYEFLRNRETLLRQNKTMLQESMKLQVHSPILKSLPAFEDYQEKLKDLKTASRGILKSIDNYIKNPADDSVLEIFNDLYNSSEVSKYDSDESIFGKAQKRKLLGNPPISNKKTIGDEINYEIILNKVNDHLIIVSRDGTFTENQYVLKKEFEMATKGKVLTITDKITDALKGIKVGFDEKLTKIENKQMKEGKDFIRDIAEARVYSLWNQASTRASGSTTSFASLTLPSFTVFTDVLSQESAGASIGHCEKCKRLGILHSFCECGGIVK